MCIPPPSRLRSCLTLADTHRWALNHTRQNPDWRLSTNSETGWTPRSWRPGPPSGRPRKTWYYNQHQVLAPEFHIGDKVYLDASDIHTTCPSQKLAHCYLGPFTVTQRVSWNAYRLQLLTSMSQLHPVFNVVKLLPSSRGPHSWLEGPSADEHGCRSQHVSNSNSASIKHLSLLPSPTASSQPTLPHSIHHLSFIIRHQWQLLISSLLNYHLDFHDIQ